MVEFKAIQFEPDSGNKRLHEGRCPACGTNRPGGPCYGHWTESIDYGREWDCDAPGPPIGACEDCPFIYCDKCKKEYIEALRGK